MNKVLIVLVLLLSIGCLPQNKSEKEVEKKKEVRFSKTIIEKHLYTLSSDEMEGRKPGTPGIEKAAKYIEKEFKRIGLTTFNNLPNYRQNFKYQEMDMCNLIGVLEGKSKKDEFFIVSAHYDHLGMMNPGEGDRIYNGANDDASGVAGILALAEYFKDKNTNERSIIFVAFTAEEIGLIGSKHFSETINAEKFIAGINLELIGKELKTKPNSAWLTGYDKSNFGEILQHNLKGTGYEIYPDPYPKFNLFFRADNASLARLGIPSHTLSTTPIDVDPYYHKVDDEAETLDVNVLTETIKAVAKGTETIINGVDTPIRIVIEEK